MRKMKRHLIQALFVLSSLPLAATCVTGAEDASAVDSQEARNDPYTNGCGPTLTTAQCAAKKGVRFHETCAFQQRIPNAYFRLGNYWDFENDPNWQRERAAGLLDPGGVFCDPDEFARDPNATCHDMKNMTLAAICGNYWATGGGSYGDIHTFIPTRRGCAALAGKWNGTYCAK